MRIPIIGLLLIAGVAGAQAKQENKPSAVTIPVKYCFQDEACLAAAIRERDAKSKGAIPGGYAIDSFAPVDVPPIFVKGGTQPAFGSMNSLLPIYIAPDAYTCADKSRFLMTAEDGSKHCIKLGKD